MGDRQERLIDASREYAKKHGFNSFMEYMAALYGLAAYESDLAKHTENGLQSQVMTVIDALRDKMGGGSGEDAIRFWEISVIARRFDGEGADSYLNLPYHEYLKTPHWQAVKAYAQFRADYRCQLCNAAGPLDVHHRTYERKGREDYRDVIALCRDCHSNFHGKG